MCKGLVCAQTLEGLLRVARGGVCMTGGLGCSPPGTGAEWGSGRQGRGGSWGAPGVDRNGHHE